jgi:hypothetical protein
MANTAEKGVIQKSNMHVDGKSDSRAVATKCSNKSGNRLAEGMQTRRPAKANTEHRNAFLTRSCGERFRGVYSKKSNR